MRSLITIALGMLLLISAAASQGNDNTAVVTVTEGTAGMLITGANLVQMSDLDANLLGNDILADQLVSLSIDDSNLVGNGLGQTNAIQTADLMLNDTGNINIDLQTIILAQGGNDLTIGNITQIAEQKADDIGNENLIDQGTIANATINLLTNSDLKQVSCLDAYVTGNINDADQDVDQSALDNDLTSSKLYEQAAINADILGNDNNQNLVPGSQYALQFADANDMVSSWANELICLDNLITGNSNNILQSAETNTTANLLTASTELQSINAKIKELGNGNFVDQNTILENSGNSAVGGHIVQQAEIETNT